MAKPAKRAIRSRSSLEKMLEILDLFEVQESGWTPERMMQRLHCPRSTLYRYLRVLTNAGLVTALADMGYALGPRIAELDYEMRSGDPLIVRGRPLLQALMKDLPGVGLLCRYYRNRVLCVHQEVSDPGLRSGYERGRAMPIGRGAASRVILAHLRMVQLRQLYEHQSGDFQRMGMGRDFAQFAERLRTIREQGYCVSRGEVTPGVIGIAAPVFDSEGTVIGSLSVTLPGTRISERRQRNAVDRICFSARALCHSMRPSTP